MMTKAKILLIATMISTAGACRLNAQGVDYSVVSVPEETGSEFVKITRENDYVCMPVVRRSSRGVEWMTNRILAVSPDGSEIAYLSQRNKSTNIFIKDIDRQGASRQRTNRMAVVDFTYSPDGKQICFSETKGKTTQMFITDARNGYVCRQITSGSNDYSPIYSSDLSMIFFTRLEQKGAGVWAYDVKDNFQASYTTGMNPFPAKDGHVLFVARQGTDGRGEIWRINYDTGVEECIIADAERSFYSPALSPDGTKLLLVGSSKIQNGVSSCWNTDIYTCRTDGTGLSQLTYHAADDLSPVWSSDGRSVYFISQRGDALGVPNVWKMTYNY